MDLIFLISVLLIWWITVKVIRKKLHISKNNFNQPVNKLQKWGEIILIIGLFTLLLLLSIAWDNASQFGLQVYQGLQLYSLLFVLSVLFGFRSFMQWKHEKLTKQYIISMLASTFLLFLFIGMVFFSSPKEMKYNVEGISYTVNSTDFEKVEMEVSGQMNRNIMYGETFFGQINVNGEEYLIISYGEESKEIPFIDRFRGTNRYYTMIELTGGKRGYIWTSRDFSTFAASVGGVKFVTPAKSVDEANELLISMPMN